MIVDISYSTKFTSVLQKYIPTINNKILVCTHVINYLCHVNAICSTLLSLYRYFKLKRLPDPEALSETLPSASTIKAANEAVLAALKQVTGRY